MTRKGAYIVLMLLTLLAVPLRIEASSLEEVEHTRHNLVVPVDDGSKSCAVCHTDRIPGESLSTDKKTPPEKEHAVALMLPPLWDTGRSAMTGYRATQTLPLNEHPYNHPTGTSLVCLSCHDGALGTDMHGINVDKPRVGAAANVPFNGMAGPRGSPPLSRVDHPISIRYPRNPGGTFVPLNPTVTRSRYFSLPDRQGDLLVLPTAATSAYLDLPEGNASSPELLSALVRTTGGMMECDSCHNPHSEEIRPFLRVPTATLCLVCHDR